jgi:hypothetical protein
VTVTVQVTQRWCEHSVQPGWLPFSSCVTTGTSLTLSVLPSHVCKMDRTRCVYPPHRVMMNVGSERWVTTTFVLPGWGCLNKVTMEGWGHD